MEYLHSQSCCYGNSEVCASQVPAVMMWSPGGRIHFANKSCCNLLGYPQDEFLAAAALAEQQQQLLLHQHHHQQRFNRPSQMFNSGNNNSTNNFYTNNNNYNIIVGSSSNSPAPIRAHWLFHPEDSVKLFQYQLEEDN